MRFGHITAWVDKGDPYRRASLDWTQTYWQALWGEYQRITDAAALDVDFLLSEPVPYSRPKAINDAVRNSDCEVFFQADPDSVVIPLQATAALHAAASAPGLVVAFNHWRYLDERSSAMLMGDPDQLDVAALVAEDEGVNTGVGNVIAFSRETWERVGGFCEAFDGIWGGDDGAFAFAAGTLVAPMRRIDGVMYHLWHPRAPESYVGHPEYMRQHEILRQYRDAAIAENRKWMRKLIRKYQGVSV